MISHTDTTYQNSRWQYHCIDSPHTSYCFHINSFLPSLSLCFTVLLRPWHQTVRAGLCFVGGVSASANRCELLWGVAASLTNSNNVMAVWWGIDWMEWERACTSQRYMSWTMMQSTKKKFKPTCKPGWCKTKCSCTKRMISNSNIAFTTQCIFISAQVHFFLCWWKYDLLKSIQRQFHTEKRD